MKIGLMSGAEGGAGSIDALVEDARSAESQGFDSFWLANIFGFDAITAQALVGRETQRIQLGTAVVPSYPRHPVAIAQQALTTASAAASAAPSGVPDGVAVVSDIRFSFAVVPPLQSLAPRPGSLRRTPPALRELSGDRSETRAPQGTARNV